MLILHYTMLTLHYTQLSDDAEEMQDEVSMAAEKAAQEAAGPFTLLPCYPALPCPALPCRAALCPALPCPALLCPTLPYPILPYPILPYPTLPYPILISQHYLTFYTDRRRKSELKALKMMGAVAGAGNGLPHVSADSSQVDCVSCASSVLW